MRLSQILVLAIAATVASAQTSSQRAPGAPAVPYTIVESRGGMRIAVIDSRNRTEKALRVLGDELRHDFASGPIVIVGVFDSPKAAAMYDRMTDSPEVSLGRSADEFYDHHMVANYSSGDRSYHYWPNGARGKQFDVKY